MEKRQEIDKACVCVSLSSEQARLIAHLISKYCLSYPALSNDFKFSRFELRAANDFAEYLYNYYLTDNKSYKTSALFLRYAYKIDENKIRLNITLYLWILLLFKRCLEISQKDNYYELSILVADIESIKKLYKYLQTYYRSLIGTEYSEISIEKWRATFGNGSPFQRMEDLDAVDCKNKDNISKQNKRFINDFTSPIPEGKLPGDILTLTLKNIIIPFSWCPSGTFLMGANIDEQKLFGVFCYDVDPDLFKDEEFSHLVTLRTGFWMMQTPVTRRMYYLFVDESNKTENDLCNNDLPINNVTWYDCMRYAEVLNERTNVLSYGFRFLLPTESQWEYACRAGSKTAFSGTQNIESMGWYDINSNDRLHSVGCKQPNNWGLYDMHGNIEEWCLDEYNSYPKQDVVDPCGTSPIFSEKIFNDFYINENICRGGSWFSPEESCRSAARSASEPSEKSDLIGFRLILQKQTG